LPSPPHQKEDKNERFVDFTFDSGRVDFCAGLAFAAHGCFHLSETGLSGQGQEGKN